MGGRGPTPPARSTFSRRRRRDAQARGEERRAARPEAIPLPRVVPAAVEAYRTLAAIRAKTDPDASLDEMLAPLDDVAEAVERAGAHFLRASRWPASPTGTSSTSGRRCSGRTPCSPGGAARLEDAVKVTYGSQKELERMAAVWKLTEQQAVADGRGRRDRRAHAAVRGEIEDLQKRVKVRLDRLLAAQDRVASLRIRILGWMGAADRADAVRERQLFEIEARPIWAVLSRKEPFRDFGEQLRRVAQHNVSAVTAFVREEGAGLPLGPGRLRGRGDRRRLGGPALRRPRRGRPGAGRPGRGAVAPRLRRHPGRAEPHLLVPSACPGGLHRALGAPRAARPPGAGPQAPRPRAAPTPLRLRRALRRLAPRRAAPGLLASRAAPHPPRGAGRPRRGGPAAPEGRALDPRDRAPPAAEEPPDGGLGARGPPRGVARRQRGREREHGAEARRWLPLHRR